MKDVKVFFSPYSKTERYTIYIEDIGKYVGWTDHYLKYF